MASDKPIGQRTITERRKAYERDAEAETEAEAINPEGQAADNIEKPTK